LILNVEIEDQKVKITNLQKLIYPDVSIIKAEIIKYYLEIAPYLLKYISNRPLTLIRFPDGIGVKKFYTKNKPSWTPKWMPYTKLPWDEENDYLFCNKTAHCVWLANLAALELHIMNSQISNIEKPDHFVIDLDPPEKQSFAIVKELALTLKSFLEKKGLPTFAKLSGGKGIHIVVPIKANQAYEPVIENIKKLMKEFIVQNPSTTLHVHKDKRKNKILLDIYRNHPGNTTIAPYSLRGKPGAPVSMPLPWQEIEKADSAQIYNLKNSLVYLNENGDAWENINDEAIDFTVGKQLPVKKSLKQYDKKRDFNKTKEPVSDVNENINDKFVLHFHDASNLHYDLRLGVDGVLKSWAIPKGLPFQDKVKRLAIQTEDHPAKYFNFEGEIPKEEYGGGRMWIFDQGEIKWDGIRAFVVKSGKEIKVISRSGRDISSAFPEFCEQKIFEVEQCILDCEIVCLDENGAPVFADVISRMHSKTVKKGKTAYLYILDCMAIDGFDISRQPLEKRKEWAEVVVKKSNIIRTSELIEDGKALFKAAEQMKLEGIIAKKKKSKYTIGKRSTDWLKIKFRSTIDCNIIGYTKGNGDRVSTFGSLHLVNNLEEMKYLGRVGSGFDSESIKVIFKKIEAQGKAKKILKEKIEEEKHTTWIAPNLRCEIEFASYTNTGHLREPVFKKLLE